MKPLAGPVGEYRLAGVLQVTAGLLLGAIAAVGQAAAVAGVEVIFAAGFSGTWMYVLAYRRFARKAVDQAATAPSAERERPGVTRRRVAVTTAALAFCWAAIVLVSHMPALVGGIAVGNGAALIATSRWLRRWAQTHQVTLLREPRWRWSRKGRRGWGRGRGMMDPQDFYVLASGDGPADRPARGAPPARTAGRPRRRVLR